MRLSELLVGGLTWRSGWRLTSGVDGGTGSFAGRFVRQVETLSCGVPGFAGGVEEAGPGVGFPEIPYRNLRGVVRSRV